MKSTGRIKSINLKKMGTSDLHLSPIGLGCWQFSGGQGIMGKYWPNLTDDETNRIVQKSIEGGINWFDTAEAYGWGASESHLSQALQSLNVSPNEIVVATKWWPLLRTAGSVCKTIGKREQALNPYKIDLYQIHQPYYFSLTAWVMRELAQLVKKDKVCYIGVSNFSARRMRKAHRELQKSGLALVCNQVRYSLLDRTIESNGVLETARELNIAIIAYSPLAQGVLTGKFHDNPDLINQRSGPRKYLQQFKKRGLEKSWPLIQELKKYARKYEVQPAQVALNWILHYQDESFFIIPGATKADHAEANTRAMRFKLDEEEIATLAKISEQIQ
jgi:aryl-alcohol dehydrogenase-like predicted oxidoreductase